MVTDALQVRLKASHAHVHKVCAEPLKSLHAVLLGQGLSSIHVTRVKLPLLSGLRFYFIHFFSKRHQRSKKTAS